MTRITILTIALAALEEMAIGDEKILLRFTDQPLGEKPNRPGNGLLPRSEIQFNERQNCLSQ